MFWLLYIQMWAKCIIAILSVRICLTGFGGNSAVGESAHETLDLGAGREKCEVFSQENNHR